MTLRERVINTFKHKPVDNIVFQPRMEYWFNRNKELGRLPAPYRDMKLLDAFDELGCSIRAYGPYTSCLEAVDPPGVKREVLVSMDGRMEKLENIAGQDNLAALRSQFTYDLFPKGGGRRIERIVTPLGTLETHIINTDYSWHITKYPIETPEDVGAMKYVLEGTSFRFNMDKFIQVEEMIGERSAPMIALPRVNLMRLIVEFMGFENTLFALNDEPRVVEDLVRTINESDERLLDVIEECPIEIVSFDDNMDQNLCSPTLFRRFVLPIYQHRSARMRAAGKTCHAHWDGDCSLLLRMAHETGLDGIEALTPKPMGVVTVDEIKAALGEDMILLDGVPMTSFLPFEKDEDLERITRQIIEAFAPNLILGISDEPSPDCTIDKMRLVADIVKDYEGKVMDLPGRRKGQE